MPSKTSWLKVHPTKCRIIYVRGWMSFGLKSGHPSGSYWLQLAAEVIQEKVKVVFICHNKIDLILVLQITNSANGALQFAVLHALLGSNPIVSNYNISIQKIYPRWYSNPGPLYGKCDRNPKARKILP